MQRHPRFWGSHGLTGKPNDKTIERLFTRRGVFEFRYELNAQPEVRNLPGGDESPHHLGNDLFADEGIVRRLLGEPCEFFFRRRTRPFFLGDDFLVSDPDELRDHGVFHVFLVSHEGADQRRDVVLVPEANRSGGEFTPDGGVGFFFQVLCCNCNRFVCLLRLEPFREDPATPGSERGAFLSQEYVESIGSHHEVRYRTNAGKYACTFSGLFLIGITVASSTLPGMLPRRNRSASNRVAVREW